MNNIDAKTLTEIYTNAEFAVTYDKQGNVYMVIGPNGKPVKRGKIGTKAKLQNSDWALVTHNSPTPCCYVVGPWEWCWC